MRQSQSHIIRLTVSAMLAALSIVVMFATRFIKFPPMPWLVYDMADIPLLISSLLYGPVYGLAALVIVCFLQAFPLGGDGLPGFLMHLVSSSALILLVGFIGHRYKRWIPIFIGMIAGIAAVTLIMIPMNLLVTVHMYNTPRAAVITGMPLILLFNASKTTIVCTVTAILFAALQPFLRRYPHMLGLRQPDVALSPPSHAPSSETSPAPPAADGEAESGERYRTSEKGR